MEVGDALANHLEELLREQNGMVKEMHERIRTTRSETLYDSLASSYHYRR